MPARSRPAGSDRSRTATSADSACAQDPPGSPPSSCAPCGARHGRRPWRVLWPNSAVSPRRSTCSSSSTAPPTVVTSSSSSTARRPVTAWPGGSFTATAASSARATGRAKRTSWERSGSCLTSCPVDHSLPRGCARPARSLRSLHRHQRNRAAVTAQVPQREPPRAVLVRPFGRGRSGCSPPSPRRSRTRRGRRGGLTRFSVRLLLTTRALV